MGPGVAPAHMVHFSMNEFRSNEGGTIPGPQGRPDADARGGSSHGQGGSDGG
jgi:hypothetical protein